MCCSESAAARTFELREGSNQKVKQLLSCEQPEMKNQKVSGIFRRYFLDYIYLWPQNGARILVRDRTEPYSFHLVAMEADTRNMQLVIKPLTDYTTFDDSQKLPLQILELIASSCYGHLELTAKSGLCATAAAFVNTGNPVRRGQVMSASVVSRLNYLLEFVCMTFVHRVSCTLVFNNQNRTELLQSVPNCL